MSIAAYGVVTFAIAAFGFLALALVLATRWEGRVPGRGLVLASLATALWAGVLAHGVWTGAWGGPPVASAGLLRNVAWLLVLIGLMERQAPWQTISRLSLGATVGAIALGIVQLLVMPAWTLGGIVLALLDIGEIALSLLGFVLLEQLYRNANPEGRRALKYLVLGVGILLAYDLFLYSEVVLLGRVEPVSQLGRALASIAVVPLIALAAHRNPGWSLSAFLSRHVVFHMTSFLGIAAYLLLLAAGAQVRDPTGAPWPRVMHAVLFVIAGAAFVLLTWSSRLRRRFRVFMGKYVYRYKYDYRIEWLRFIEALSDPQAQSDVRSNAVRAIAQIIGSPGGVLYLADGTTGAFIAVAAWPAEGTAVASLPSVGAEEDLPNFLRRREWVVDLKESEGSPDLYDQLKVPRGLGYASGFRMVVPLVLGRALPGFVLLRDPQVPFDTTYEDRDLLKTVGLDVAVRLARYEADRELAESRQFEAYHRLTAFVMHDLKGLAAQLSMVVGNADRHRRNPEFVDDAISTIALSATRMQQLIEQLQGQQLHVNLRRTSLRSVVHDACKRCSHRAPVPTLRVGSDDAFVRADPERLGTMVEHLIRNAQDATDETGEITISVHCKRDGEMDVALVSVSDTGVGMTPQFIRERLFRPFDSTKGAKGMGIGAHEVRQYVQGLGGGVEVLSAPGAGTTVTLRLPAWA